MTAAAAWKQQQQHVHKQKVKVKIGKYANKGFTDKKHRIKTQQARWVIWVIWDVRRKTKLQKINQKLKSKKMVQIVKNGQKLSK